MEIQKIFTDLYDDERIYSVLMNENELYLFSEIQKEFNDKKKKKGKSDGKSNNSGKGIGRGLVAGGLALNTLSTIPAVNWIENPGNEEGAKLLKEIEKKIRKEVGTKIDYNTPTGVGPCATIDGKTIYMSGSKNAGVASHEAGHAYLNKTKKTKGIEEKLGKLAHKGYIKLGGSVGQFHRVGPASGIIAGAISGTRAANLENKGEKESKINRHASWAVPLVAQAPGLSSEALASRKGYRMLKEAGASKKYLKEVRKGSKAAFGTYAGVAAMNAGLGEISRKAAYKLNKKEKEEDI